jgi:hypothetical protein
MSNEKSAIRSAIEEMTDRRLDPRVRATAGYFWRRWVALSAFRRAVVTLLMAGAVGGTTFAACQSSSITGPAESSTGTISRHDSYDDDDHDGDDDDGLIGTIVNLLPSKKEISDDDALRDPDFVEATETTFPTTEAVYNVCMNESPVLNGYIKVKTKLVLDEGTMKYKLRSWKDTRGVYATVKKYRDHDNNALTPPEEYLVKYHNKQVYLDEFEVGPAGLPFESEQEDIIWLQREGRDDGVLATDKGDDMFVYARQKVKVSSSGHSYEKFTHKTECK